MQNDAIAKIEITPTNKWLLFESDIKKSKRSHAVYFQSVRIGSCDFKNFKFS